MTKILLLTDYNYEQTEQDEKKLKDLYGDFELVRFHSTDINKDYIINSVNKSNADVLTFAIHINKLNCIFEALHQLPELKSYYSLKLISE